MKKLLSLMLLFIEFNVFGSAIVLAADEHDAGALAALRALPGENHYSTMAIHFIAATDLPETTLPAFVPATDDDYDFFKRKDYLYGVFRKPQEHAQAVNLYDAAHLGVRNEMRSPIMLLLNSHRDGSRTNAFLLILEFDALQDARDHIGITRVM
jgi:hypothetical protein